MNGLKLPVNMPSCPCLPPSTSFVLKTGWLKSCSIISRLLPKPLPATTCTKTTDNVKNKTGLSCAAVATRGESINAACVFSLWGGPVFWQAVDMDGSRRGHDSVLLPQCDGCYRKNRRGWGTNVWSNLCYLPVLTVHSLWSVTPWFTCRTALLLTSVRSTKNICILFTADWVRFFYFLHKVRLTVTLSSFRKIFLHQSQVCFFFDKLRWGFQRH